MTKKYVGGDGGRYIYNQDLEAMQDVGFSLAQAIFSSFGNMVVSGAEINDSGTDISKGSVYINGYIRPFSGSKVTKFPVYLYEMNREETVQYQDEQSKVGRIVYGVGITESEPNGIIDPVTNKKVEFIKILKDESQNPTLKNLFFGKHSVLKNTSVSQMVSGKITFAQSAIFSSDTFFNQAVKIGTTSITGYKDKMSFYVGEDEVMTIAADGTIWIPKSKLTINSSGIELPQAKISNVLINGDGISMSGTSEMMMNKSPLKKENSVSILDGVNRMIHYLAGSGFIKFLKKIVVNGEVEVENKTFGKDMDGYEASILFTDKDSEESFSIKTTQAGTVISSKGITLSGKSINIEAEIVMENGTELSKKYASLEVYDKEKKMYVVQEEGKSLSDENYTKGEKTKLESIKTTKLSEKYSDGYVTSRDVNEALEQKLSKEKNLKDLDLDDDDKKRAVCATLGAAFNDDVERKRKDTGWVKMSHPTNGELHDLFARQIGNQVWIQGNLKTSSTVGKGVFAKIPNSINPPAYDVYASFHEISNKGDNRGLSVMIKKTTVNLIEYERAKYEGNTVIININYLTN